MLAGRVLSRVAQTSGRRMGHTSSEVPTFFYDNVWRKKTSLYAAWMFSGAAVLIFGGGAFGDFVWDSINSGKTYQSVNWSNFKAVDAEEEE